MTKVILIIGTFNTKESEARYLRNQIEKFGHSVVLLDVSMKKYTPKSIKPDFPNEVVASAAGMSIKQVEILERMPALEIMVKGATKIVKELYDSKKLDGVLGYGGSTGESIASLVQKVLPLGLPKVLLTTSLELAAGSVEHKDIVLVPSVADMAGGHINRVEAITLANAAAAIVGMVEAKPEAEAEKPVIVASQYGNTTPHIEKAREILENKGYEFISFHAVGTGGKAMEELIRSGTVGGVLDITTHELVDWVFGGFASAGPNRMETAGEMGIPQVLVPGCLDMIQFWSTKTVPEKFKMRHFYYHNPNSTLMRTTKSESSKLGKVFAEKANKAKGPTVVAIPLKGWSICDTKGGVSMVDYYGKPTGKLWHDPESNNAFVDSLEKHINKDKSNIGLIKVDLHINDPKFAEMTSTIIDDMVRGKWKR